MNFASKYNSTCFGTNEKVKDNWRMQEASKVGETELVQDEKQMLIIKRVALKASG